MTAIKYVRLIQCKMYSWSCNFLLTPFLSKYCHLLNVSSATLFKVLQSRSKLFQILSNRLDPGENIELLGISSGSKLFAYSTSVAIGRLMVKVWIQKMVQRIIIFWISEFVLFYNKLTGLHETNGILKRYMYDRIWSNLYFSKKKKVLNLIYFLAWKARFIFRFYVPNFGLAKNIFFIIFLVA